APELEDCNARVARTISHRHVRNSFSNPSVDQPQPFSQRFPGKCFEFGCNHLDHRPDFYQGLQVVVIAQGRNAPEIRYLWNSYSRWFVHRRDSSVLELTYMNG